MNEYSKLGVFNVRRDYNAWVADETMEDFALRYTPKSFRKWSIASVANTAFSTSSFMVLEALGATLLIHYGGINTFFAILTACLIIFSVSIPIGYYAAKYNLDMDLLTRGSGFGYLGSTITSLIYAAFTFIFFALEATIMAYALNVAFNINLTWAYLISALVVIPIVTQGITSISKFQTVTQLIWLILLILPYVYLFSTNTALIEDIMRFGGLYGESDKFQLQKFFSALTVIMPLLAQMGEQADYLRFMPPQVRNNKGRWLIGVIVGGSGWVILSMFKIFGGAILAYIAYRFGTDLEHTLNPNTLYFIVYRQIFNNHTIVLILATTLILISQLKINVTNAYAGSLAWSNFFSRITHSHPGRVVWVIFNIVIALLLMELNLIQVMDTVLGVFSNIAVPWIITVFADIIINKPLGLSPEGIEFRRAYLFDINPVGVFSVIITSCCSILIYIGFFGNEYRPYAILVSLVFPLLLSPIIAFYTKGKFYIARNNQDHSHNTAENSDCVVCGNKFEKLDMALCPAYQGSICSLCCTLDVRCQDQCKPYANISSQINLLIDRYLPKKIVVLIRSGLGHYLILFFSFVLLLMLFLILFYYQDLYSNTVLNFDDPEKFIKNSYIKIFISLTLVMGIVSWWLVLVSRSRKVAYEEAKSQTELLMKEIVSHQKTDKLLHEANLAADFANAAKSRYIMSVSHELRTPLNSILGYAQILDSDKSIPENRKNAVATIRKSGEHLLSLIEGTLDIARIESGKMKLKITQVQFRDLIQQIVSMFELQAYKKNLKFEFEALTYLPVIVRADSARVRQILINILGNAIKFTMQGKVVFKTKYQGDIATFIIEDTGPGINNTDLEKIFEPFARGTGISTEIEGGTGLGLTITKMLIGIMGGEITVTSQEKVGTTFTIKLYLPQVITQNPLKDFNKQIYIGYEGPRRRVMVVDNEEIDRTLLKSFLGPLGFDVIEAESGDHCLNLLNSINPDIIFMDLAMPGIDGWETIYKIKRKFSDKNFIFAIISANAFEINTENNVGITSESFFTKPVSIDELLRFIGDKLSLKWITHTVEPTSPSLFEIDYSYPPDEYLNKIKNSIDAGYWKGILIVLDEVIYTNKKYQDFVNHSRTLASQFKLDELRLFIDKGLSR
ncbi:response regulator [Ferrovum sp. PN-J185]|uniref:hybrid sensor histidine kinase/response regulator n=1 Tax=Ferrovum sp. PN-J185 TaxID=1356306 RepID=UPI00079C13D8|nr:ATP-binding protein [Ferrovum sp. PN-J185]KXW56929.1 autoinducer 2 sensor kinase/phosphatase LuxQ [Ferrovum sp. PN-J185]MCC6069198.1 response regulator [Ferrovum sp. PN-J185]